MCHRHHLRVRHHHLSILLLKNSSQTYSSNQSTKPFSFIFYPFLSAISIFFASYTQGFSYHIIMLVISLFVINLYNITPSLQFVKSFLCSTKDSFCRILANRIAHLCCFKALILWPPVYQIQTSTNSQNQILSVINKIKTFYQ